MLGEQEGLTCSPHPPSGSTRGSATQLRLWHQEVMGTRRRGPGQHRGVDGARGGLLWAVPRAGRPASCSQNTPRAAGKTDWTLGGQDADSDLRRRGPAASSGSGPPQTPGRCVRKAQPRGHTRGTGSCSAFTRCATQPDADPQNHLWSAARRGDARAPLRGPDLQRT